MPYALNRKKKKADFSTRVCYFYLKKKKEILQISQFKLP